MMNTSLKIIFACLMCSFGIVSAENRVLKSYDQKVVDFYKEHGHYTDHPGYPEGHQYWKDLAWFREQGDKVRLGLMYLLEHEYKNQWEKMSDVMCGLSHASGDKSDLIEHIRKNLPNLIGDEEGEKHGYKHTSIRFLAQYGNATDIPLLEKFLDAEGILPQAHVKASIKKLKNRLAKEKEISVIHPNRSRRHSENSAQATAKVPEKSSGPAQTGTVEKTKTWYKCSVILAVIFSLGGLAIWIQKRGRSKK